MNDYKYFDDLNIELIDGDRGKNYPRNDEMFEKEYCLFLNAKNVTVNGFVFDENVFITKEKDELLRKGKLNRNDIVLTTRGTIGNVGLYDESVKYDNVRINSGMLIIRNNDSNINTKYLYYQLTSPFIRDQIFSLKTGSAQPQIPITVLKKLKLLIPDKNIQGKIVKVMDSVVNKINLNNEINNNLSEQIKSIYNEIFTEFIDYKRLDEISNVTIGKTPPRSEQECFTTDKNDVKWISISDLGKSGMFIFDTSEKLTQEAVDKYNVKVIPKDTVILSFKLTVGRTGFTTEDMTTNEAIAHFDLNNKELNNYLYCTLTYYNYSDLGSTSSIATAINSKIVKSIKIGIPSDEQLNKFNNLTSAMFKTIKNNESENIKLSELRDTLLPKLMNGEIDLDKIEL